MSERYPGYTADRLLGDLADARRTELELLDGLTEPQMLGTRAHFIEPPIWEMGHVGWFQEYWISRHLDGHPTLLPVSDGRSRLFAPRHRGTRRNVHARGSARGVIRVRQREVGSSGRGQALPDRVDRGDERGIPAVRERRWVPAPRSVEPSWLGLATSGRGRAPAVLGLRGGRALVRPRVLDHRAPRALAPGRPRELVRSGSLLPLGWAPLTQRGGVGDGCHLRSFDGAEAPLSLGRRGPHPRAREPRLPRGRHDRCAGP